MKNFASDSTIHGVNFIFGENRSKFTRFLWFFILLASLCGFFYYFKYGYTKWQFRPDIAMRSQERNIREFPMPAITICPRIFAKNYQANYTEIFVFNLNSSRSKCEFAAANVNWCDWDSIHKVKSSCSRWLNEMEHINILDLVDKSGFERHEVLDDDRNDFTRVVTNRGFCFSYNIQDFGVIFNENEISDDFHYYKNSKNLSNEWTVERGYFSDNSSYPKRLIARGDNYFKLNLTLEDSKNSCGSIYVVFHLPSEMTTVFHTYVPVNYGSISTLFIKAKSYRTDEALRAYSPDVRKCFFDGERKLKFFKFYSKAHCEVECAVNALIKFCGCVQFWHPRNKTIRICNFSEFDCLKKFRAFYTAEKGLSDCNCYPACNNIKYEIEHYPARYRRTTSVWYNGTSIETFINCNVVEEIENFLTYKLQSFIADIGGLLGLFLGCSILSIVEIFYFLFAFILKKFTKKEKKKTTQGFFQKPEIFYVKEANSNSKKNVDEFSKDIAKTLKKLDMSNENLSKNILSMKKEQK